MVDLIWAALVGATPTVLILVYFVLNPEKIEIWSALFWKALNACGGILKFAHKNYLKHDLQGRVNHFIRGIKIQIPDLGREKLRIEWVDPSTDRQSFIADGKVVVRLRREDPQDHNFVHASYYYVSGMLLRKAKRYLSENQRGAIDVFVCLKLLESEKPSVVTYFLDEYAHQQASKPKIRALLAKFENFHRAGYYFPVFMQELQFLGDKIFGTLKKSSVEAEVSGLINFLSGVANREVGTEETKLDFKGAYCKLAVVIVGKAPVVIKGSGRYVKYLSKLKEEEIDTIYLISPIYNKLFVNDICKEINHIYVVRRQVSFIGRIIIDGEQRSVKAHLVVLRQIGATPIQPQ